MKDKRLLIPVSPKCTTRKFYLIPPPEGRHDYHYRFTPPKGSGVGRVFRGTGTSNIAAAKDIAARAIESFWTDGGQAAEMLKLRANVATVGEVIERYEKGAEERPGTIRGNISSLRLIIKTVHSGDPDTKPTSILTDDLIREFAAMRTNGLTGADLKRAKGTVASYVTQARSILALGKMKLYEGLKLPALDKFREERVSRPKKGMPRPLDMNAMAAMTAASAKLATDDPGVYVAHLMFAYWGMRNVEILHARTWWVVNGRIGIIEREEENFSPKGCEGWVEVDAGVLAEVLRFQHLCRDGYLIPGATMTERHEAIYRRHSKWVSTWIKDRTKTSYELRRYAGSRLLDMGASIIQVRDFLRHSDSKTTERWYAYRLQNRQLPTIGLGQLLPKAGAA